MRPPPLVVLLVLAAACRGPEPAAPAPTDWVRPAGEQRFFDWSEVDFGVKLHAARRWSLVRRLEGEHGLVLIPSRPARSGGETFRQLDDFAYFTGLELPDSVLALDLDRKRAAVFAPHRDPRFESASRPNDFPGRPLADDPELSRRSGIDVRPREELAGWLEGAEVLWIDAPGLALGAEVALPETDFVREYSPVEALALHLARVAPDAGLVSCYAAVARERLVKSPEEVERLRRACAVTAAGIRHAAGFVRPGVDERTLEAELEAEFKRRGAQRLAFDSIVKSGPNSLWPWRILAAHYDRRNRALEPGDLVIFDVGCELDGYASDVGRTFPASGRFTEHQREVLAMETRVADAVIAAVRPGRTFAELREVAQAAMPERARPFMQTGSFYGHHVGLAVGDPSLDDLPLEPGMVFTIEPWYYDHEGRLAVFVEDVVVVTADGCEVLTAGLPRDPEALERMTGRSR